METGEASMVAVQLIVVKDRQQYVELAQHRVKRGRDQHGGASEERPFRLATAGSEIRKSKVARVRGWPNPTENPSETVCHGMGSIVYPGFLPLGNRSHSHRPYNDLTNTTSPNTEDRLPPVFFYNPGNHPAFSVRRRLSRTFSRRGWVS